jgi:hypothetical protein
MPLAPFADALISAPLVKYALCGLGGALFAYPVLYRMPVRINRTVTDHKGQMLAKESGTVRFGDMHRDVTANVVDDAAMVGMMTTGAVILGFPFGALPVMAGVACSIYNANRIYPKHLSDVSLRVHAPDHVATSVVELKERGALGDGPPMTLTTVARTPFTTYKYVWEQRDTDEGRRLHKTAGMEMSAQVGDTSPRGE